jgi:quercetin dioxygenase-like cupin family protein
MSEQSAQAAAPQEMQSGSLVRFFDLQALATFREEGPAIRAVTETQHARFLLLAFKAGQQLKEHRTTSQLFVQVLRGHVIFTVQEQSFQLTAGTALQVAAATPHSLSAPVESVVLLTMIADLASPQNTRGEASNA